MALICEGPFSNPLKSGLKTISVNGSPIGNGHEETRGFIRRAVAGGSPAYTGDKPCVFDGQV